MKRIELTIVILIILAVMLSLAPLSGMLFLSVWLMLVLTAFYLLLSFLLLNGIKLGSAFKKEAYKGVSTNQMLGSIGTGMLMAFTCVAIIFKLFSWPGSLPLLLLSAFLLLVVFVISFIKFKSAHKLFYKRVIIRAGAFGIICLVLSSLPEIFFMEVRYRHYPDYIEAVKRSNADPGNNQLIEKLNEEREIMYKKK